MPVVQSAIKSGVTEAAISLFLYEVSRHYQLNKLTELVAVGALSCLRAPSKVREGKEKRTNLTLGAARAIQNYVDITTVTWTLKLLSQFRTLSAPWKAVAIGCSICTAGWVALHGLSLYVAQKRAADRDGVFLSPLDYRIAKCLPKL